MNRSLAEHAAPLAIASGTPPPNPEPKKAKEFAPSRRPDAWRVNDALRQLSISRATLYKMIKAGDLRMSKIARRSLFPDTEIRRLVDEAA